MTHRERNPNIADNRICPFCAETIKSEAKICPHCRQWLTFRSIRNPAIAVWAYGLPHLALYALISMLLLIGLDKTQNPKPNYSDFVNSLQVTESRMGWVATKDGLRIYLTGILTNQSPVAWRDIEFQCRFFDAKGVLIDAAHPHAGLTIQAHDDSAFRALVIPTRSDTNDYVSFKLSVSTARNTKGLF